MSSREKQTILSMVEPDEARRMMREALAREGCNVRKAAARLDLGKPVFDLWIARLGMRPELQRMRERLAKRFVIPSTNAGTRSGV